MKCLFVKQVIQEYNNLFRYNIIFGCSCYNLYNTEENFITNVIKKKNSYLCCIVILTQSQNERIIHNRFPILMGSEIDWHIRKDFIKKEDCRLFGTIIIDGHLNIVPNFITNRLGNAHVYISKKNGKSYEINYSDNDDILKLSYQPLHNSYEYSFYKKSEIKEAASAKKKKRKLLSNEANAAAAQELSNSQKQSTVKEKKKCTDNKWISFYQQHCIVDSDKCINTEDKLKCLDLIYKLWFRENILHAPELDDLSNKIVITVGVLFDRMKNILIEKHTTPGKSKNRQEKTETNTLVEKFKLTFKSGNGFFALSNKNVNKILSEYNRVYEVIEAQKIDKAYALVSVVKRAVSEESKNSNALIFPRDGEDFICPLNIKELKGAGENIYLSQLVISSSPIPESSILNALDTLCERSESFDSIDEGYWCVVVDSIITRYRAKSTLDTLVAFKQKIKQIVLFRFGCFLQIITTGSIIMKYSELYDFYVTPYEKQHFWPNAFKNYHKILSLSSIGMYLPQCLVKAQPPKLVVAIQNFKGGCFEGKSKLMTYFFLYSIGYKCALVHNKMASQKISIEGFPVSSDESVYNYLHLANLPKRPMPECVDLFLKLKQTDLPQYDEFRFNSFSVFFGVEIFDKIDNAFIKTKDSVFFFKNIESEYVGLPRNVDFLTIRELRLLQLKKDSAAWSDAVLRGKDGEPVMRCKMEDFSELDTTYKEMLKIKNDEIFTNHLVLWCAFGDVCGATNEDGIIIDQKLTTEGPQKLICVTLHVRFYEPRSDCKKILSKSCNVKYLPINKEIDNVMLFGVMYSKNKLLVQKSKNVNVNEIIIKDTFMYLIYIHSFCNKKRDISSFYTDENQKVTITYKYFRNLGVGVKLANIHGQKGVVSMVADLSTIVGWTKSGEVVHPQVLMSPISIIGRTVSSQVYSMLCSSECAVTESGSLIAKMVITVHHIDDTVQAAQTSPKIDLMMSENGFIANSMPYCLSVANMQNPIVNIKKKLSTVKELLNVAGVELQFINYDNNLQEMSNYLAFGDGNNSNVARTVTHNSDDEDEDDLTNDDDDDDNDNEEVQSNYLDDDSDCDNEDA